MTETDVQIQYMHENFKTLVDEVKAISSSLNGKDGIVTQTALNREGVNILTQAVKLKADKEELTPIRRVLYGTFFMVLLAAFKVWWPA